MTLAKDMDDKKLLTVKQVARILEVHPNTVRLWANNGHLRSTYRIGTRSGPDGKSRGDRRFLAEDIKAYLVAHREQG